MLRTKTQLRALRLKPAPDQRPVDRYWQGFHWVSLYDSAAAVAMRPYRAPTPAQAAALSAGRLLIGTALCRTCGTRVLREDRDRREVCVACREAAAQERAADQRREACQAAADIVALDPLFLDVETTGLDEAAEVIEIAIVDRHGAVLLDSLVKPQGAISPEAQAIHGIMPAMLDCAPCWAAVAPRVAALLHQRLVVAHHAAFDARLMRQSCARYGLQALFHCNWACTLELLTECNGGRWSSLSAAIHLAGAKSPAEPIGSSHRARYDAECCRRIIIALAREVTAPL